MYLNLQRLEIPHAVEGAHGNHITDPFNINEEHCNDFDMG